MDTREDAERPGGYHHAPGKGSTLAFQSALVRSSGLSSVAAVVAMYIVLGILYEIIHLITILSTLPTGRRTAGAPIAGGELDVIAIIGISVLLIGIVKRRALS